MIKADLHVHTKYSANPADVLLRKFGTQESYTEVEEVYRQAKAHGMALVTVTDHNTIDGALKLVQTHPEDTFTGVELTTCFPEDGCAVHILVYDFTPAQFAIMDRLRPDIYALRDYLRHENLPYSVAHATYSVNGKLTLSHIEKLILLFDVFECVNGTRVGTYNDLLKRALKHLTPQKIDQLRRRHVIEPFSETPWLKGFTGGSDEHAGLFIGESFTAAEGMTRDDFLMALRLRRTDSGGRSNHYKTQVFTFLKIAYESSKSPGPNERHGGRAWNELCAIIYDGKRPGILLRLKLWQMQKSPKAKDREVGRQIARLITELSREPQLPLHERVDAIYNAMAAIEDAFFIINADAFREAFKARDAFQLMSALTALFRSVFLSLPFLGTFRHLHQSSSVMKEFRREFLGEPKANELKVLWFTDTLNDMNGVAVTLRSFAVESISRGHSVRIVAVKDESVRPALYQLELPLAYTYTPEFYSTFTLKFPSLLKSLELIYAESPTEIIVSTPGPVGLIGILAARLFGIPCRSIYHSDFTRMAELGLSGGTLASFVQGYVRWFYSCTDEIKAPTKETLQSLLMRRFEASKLTIFRRGIDLSMFRPIPEPRPALRLRYGLDDAFTLLYAGRISKDKSVGFMVDIYRELCNRGFKANLIMCGDGPELDNLRKQFADDPRVRLTGRVAREDLPVVYSLSDLFVFPSTMDTFGMAVLEAQACGLPALVTNVGGPQEIIVPEETGYVLPATEKEAWVHAIMKVKAQMDRDPRWMKAVREASRRRVSERFGWDEAIEDLFSDKTEGSVSFPG